MKQFRKGERVIINQTAQGVYAITTPGTQWLVLKDVPDGCTNIEIGRDMVSKEAKRADRMEKYVISVRYVDHLIEQSPLSQDERIVARSLLSENS